MKRIIAVAALITIFLVLPSCVPDTPEPPYGVWKSEDPHIVLFFKPEHRIPIGMPAYLGFYTVDSTETKVFARFGKSIWCAVDEKMFS